MCVIKFLNTSFDDFEDLNERLMGEFKSISICKIHFTEYLVDRLKSIPARKPSIFKIIQHCLTHELAWLSYESRKGYHDSQNVPLFIKLYTELAMTK